MTAVPFQLLKYTVKEQNKDQQAGYIATLSEILRKFSYDLKIIRLLQSRRLRNCKKNDHLKISWFAGRTTMVTTLG